MRRLPAVPMVVLGVAFLMVTGMGLGWAPLRARAQSVFSATTTVNISVCGNGVVEPPIEVCDDGVNNGLYATSTAGRNCMPGCRAFAPYCGDGVLQQLFNEQCDDGNNISGDGCSTSCQIESLAGPSGGGGGGAGPYPGGNYSPIPDTQVILQGKAYPGASVNILRDGAPIGVVQADTSANFYFSTKSVTPGVTTFGFWAQDNLGLKSVALTTTLTITANAVTTISGEYLPPTIAIDKRQYQKGEKITVSGQSAPAVTVETHFHSTGDVVAQTSTENNGNWSLVFDSSQLAPDDFHTVGALFVTSAAGVVQRSAFSQQLSFYIGQKNVGKSFLADLNHDGKINLADFSILLFYWGTSTPLADLNNDGKVGLQDFSILLYNWTG